MEKEIIEKIKELIDERKKDDGWTDMASLGNALNNVGIDYNNTSVKKTMCEFQAYAAELK